MRKRDFIDGEDGYEDGRKGAISRSTKEPVWDAVGLKVYLR